MSRICIWAIVLFAVAHCAIAFPTQMNYQGKLTDTLGVAVSGTLFVGFSVWNEETSGDSLWGEYDTVQVRKGLFDINLGRRSPLNVDFSVPTFMQLIVNGERLTPRQPLNPVPSAFHAKIADSLVGGVILEHNSLLGIQGGSTSERYHLTLAEKTQIATNATNIGDLDYSEENYVTSGEPLTASIDALDQAVADIEAGTSNTYIKNQEASAQTANYWISGNGRLDGNFTVGNIVGQGSAFDDISSTLPIASTTLPTTLAEISYSASGAGSTVHLSFAGTFDDKGGQDGAYILVELVRNPGTPGETIISQSQMSIYSLTVYQLQTFAINGVDIPPDGSVTYRVRAKVVKEPYTGGRCLSGVLSLAEIKN